MGDGKEITFHKFQIWWYNEKERKPPKFWAVRSFTYREGTDGEPVADKPHRRVIGQVETSFRDVAYTGGVQPYTVFLWQRLIAAGRHPAAKALFAEHDLSPLVDVDLPIRVERRDNIEVWG